MSEDNTETERDPVKEHERNGPRSERSRTDESLRAERQAADAVLQAELAAIDEAADLVVNRARARADEVLAAARAKSDRRARAHASGAQGAAHVDTDRLREDQVVEDERADADEILREERSDQVRRVSREREDTDKDLSEERAHSDDALAVRDEFLGIVSHELRNMLNGILGSAELLAKGLSRENRADQMRVSVQRIQRSAVRMNRLIGDLVDVASIEAGRLVVTREVGDAQHVVMEAVETLQAQASASGVSLVAEAGPSSVAAFDPARILQVLINLLSNAVKFTPAPGKVTVGVARSEREIRFSVSDTGTGIPTDQLEAIFERFLQLTKNDRRGLGLGLYISKAIVEGHGGRIWAENRIGGGSTFCFTLPVEEASAP